MIDNLLGNDEDEDIEEPDDDEGMDGMFDEADDGSGLDDTGDDLMGGDEMSFDGMNDQSDGGATSGEMSNRLDELENEVASLSSSVNTAKSENEQISESLEDVEENIRKLLEVYEMVTRGVNPFVNEDELGDAFGGDDSVGDGGMDLFGGDEEGSDADIDDSIADADADDFFDNDIDDDGFDDEFDGGDDAFEDDGGDDAFEDDGGDDAFEDDGGDDDDNRDDGGKSFEDLKQEYESGDAEWDEDGEDSGGVSEDDSEQSSESGERDIVEDVLDADEPDVSEVEAETVEGDASIPEHSEGEDPAETSSTAQTPTASESAEGGKPYLESLPSGYMADIVVMDWLEFLVDEAGVDGAARTIAYYAAIEWVDEEAADTLQTFLQGFGEGIVDDPEPRSPLTVSHHNTSLRFISRIASPDMEMVAFDERSGRSRGPAPGRHPATNVSQPARPNSDDPDRGNNPPVRGGIESDGGRRTMEERDLGRSTRKYPPERYPGGGGSERHGRDDQPSDTDWNDE